MDGADHSTSDHSQYITSPCNSISVEYHLRSVWQPLEQLTLREGRFYTVTGLTPHDRASADGLPCFSCKAGRSVWAEHAAAAPDTAQTFCYQYQPRQLVSIAQAMQMRQPVVVDMEGVVLASNTVTGTVPHV